MKIILIFFITVLLNFNTISSQTYNSIKELNMESGLPSDVIYNVVQDNNGYVWIATENGVVKFNGTSYKIFQKKEGLPNNDIFRINVDSKNRIWLTGFHKGLYYIENDIVKKINKTEVIAGLSYSFEKDEKIYFNVFYDYKSYFLDNRGTLYDFHLGSPDKAVVDYYKKDNIFIGYDNLKDQFFFSQKNKHYLIPKNYFYVKNLLRQGPSFVFDNSNKRLYSPERKINSKTIYIKNNIIYSQKIPNINTTILNKEDDSNYNIIKNNDHIQIYKSGKYEKELTDKINKLGFLKNDINFIMIDKNQNFWIVNNNQKLFFVPNNFDSITSYLLLNGVNSKHSQIFGDNYYIISTDKILYCYNFKNNSLKKIKSYQSLNPRKIIINNNILAISCTEGLDYPNKEKEFFQMVNRKSIIFGNDIYQLNMSRIYKNKTIIFKNNNAIRYNEILISNNNKILISNEEEITLFDESKKTTLTNSNLKSINSLGKLNDNYIVGTNSNGLYLLDNCLRVLHKTLENEIIYSINTDPSTGEIFVASNRGLDIFKIINQSLILIKSLNTKDGFISGKTNNIQFNNKFIFISTSNGLSILDRNKIFIDKRFGKIDIDGILINGIKEKNNSKKMIFERNENNININTSIFSFQNSNNFKKYYSFSHNDTNTNWKPFNEKNLIFRELQPGNYNIKLKLVSNNLSQLYDKKSINLTIKYHFWETLFFKIVIAIILISSTIIIYIYYQKKTSRKYKLKLRLYNLELKALKAQMNPHFIFNSLNNFQSLYILEGERSANNFLSKFSLFIRKTLEIVNKDSISLHEEIEFIKSYVEIESLKNNINIDFKVNIDKKIQIKNISIPVMILQPIVENSIIHGLLPSKKEKQIVLDLKNISNSIEITIEDNGIGLNNTKKEEHKKHESYATKIIKDRIKILNTLSKKEIYNLIIEDINKSNSLKHGTKATLIIPITEID